MNQGKPGKTGSTKGAHVSYDTQGTSSPRTSRTCFKGLSDLSIERPAWNDGPESKWYPCRWKECAAPPAIAGAHVCAEGPFGYM